MNCGEKGWKAGFLLVGKSRIVLSQPTRRSTDSVPGNYQCLEVEEQTESLQNWVALALWASNPIIAPILLWTDLYSPIQRSSATWDSPSYSFCSKNQWQMARRASVQLYLVCQLQLFLDWEVLFRITHVLVTSPLNYCTIMHLVALENPLELQLVQNGSPGQWRVFPTMLR